MFAAFRRTPTVQPATEQGRSGLDVDRLVGVFSERSSDLGREAAEVRGVLDDTQKTAAAQAAAVQALAQGLQEVVRSQDGIAEEVNLGLRAVTQVGDAVAGVADEVSGIVDTLQEVSDAAQQITQIALQTRLVAFNASVEAKRAGEAGRGFAVVADAVKDLAAQVESSSKAIMGTVKQLGGRIDTLAREISREGAPEQQGTVYRALGVVGDGVQRIAQASARSRDVCGGLTGQMSGIETEMRRTTTALDAALLRTDGFLRISEQLIEAVAECGVETDDTPFIRAAQQAAAQIAKLLEDAVRTGAISAQGPL